MNLYSISISPVRNEDKSSCTDIHQLLRDCCEIINTFSNKFVASLEHGQGTTNLNHVQIAAWSDNDAKVIKQKFTRKFEKTFWWNGWGKEKSGKCAVCKNRTTEPWITVYPLKEDPEYFLIVGITDEEKLRWAAQDAAAPNLKKKRPVKDFLNFDRAILKCAEYVEPYLWRRKPEKKVVYSKKVITDVTYDEDDLPVKKRKVVTVPHEEVEEFHELDYHHCGTWYVAESGLLKYCMENGMDIWRMFNSNKKAVMYVAIELRFQKDHKYSNSVEIMKKRIEKVELRLQDQQSNYNLVDNLIEPHPCEGENADEMKIDNDAVEAKLDFID